MLGKYVLEYIRGGKFNMGLKNNSTDIEEDFSNQLCDNSLGSSHLQAQSDDQYYVSVGYCAVHGGFKNSAQNCGDAGAALLISSNVYC